nr:hypothetical protein [Candidatus Sigynarchaeota archaeon]
MDGSPMNARDRVITALERRGEPDRVPSFAEGMMQDFQRNSLGLYEDDVQDDDVLMVERDWTLFKYFMIDSVWLHSTPISYKPMQAIDFESIHVPDNGKVNRMGHVHRQTTSGSWKYQTGYLNTEDLWNEWIDAGYFDIQFSESWV